MEYLDTSVVIAALVPERHTDRVQIWLAAQSSGHLVVSLWVSSEVSSALSIKLRTGSLALDQRADVLASWHRMLEHNLIIEPIGPKQFEIAAHFADRYETGLRAGDALHLAVASTLGHRLVTLDIGMAKAASELGVPVLLL